MDSRTLQANRQARAVLTALRARPRAAYFDEELRQLIYKSHRVIFTIDDSRKNVIVLFVRHAKRRAKGEPSDEEDGA